MSTPEAPAPAPFAKIIQVPGRSAMAVFIVPTSLTDPAAFPTIEVVGEALGVWFSTQLSPPAREPVGQALKTQVAHVLMAAVDDAKAKEMLDALESSVRKAAPVQAMLRELHQEFGLEGSPAAFARLATGPSGAQVLLLKGKAEVDAAVVLRAITAQEETKIRFSSAGARDAAFADLSLAQPHLPPTQAAELGFELPAPRKSRKPRGP